MKTTNRNLFFETLTHLDNDLVTKRLGYEWYCIDPDSSITIASDFWVIPAESTDLSLPLTLHSSALMVLLYDVGQSEDLSVKINGDTNPSNIANVRGISGPLTSLSVTNASDINARILRVYWALPSGTIEANVF